MIVYHFILGEDIKGAVSKLNQLVCDEYEFIFLEIP